MIRLYLTHKQSLHGLYGPPVYLPHECVSEKKETVDRCHSDKELTSTSLILFAPGPSAVGGSENNNNKKKSQR